MAPTLIGNTSQRVHYGISDNHESALKNLNRFDVVITYYPSSWNISEEDETYKIKRVWGFPGESLSLTENSSKGTYTFTASKEGKETFSIVGNIVHKEFEFYGELTTVQFVYLNKTFYTRVGNAREITTHRSLNQYSLNEDKKEYFLMGDNWTNSNDSYLKRNEAEKIKFTDLQGRVVAIQGTAKLVNNELTDIDTKGAKSNF